LNEIKNAVKNEEYFLIKNNSTNSEFKVKLDLNKREREILLAGGLLNYISKQNLEEN